MRKDVYTMKTTIKKMDFEKVMALPRPRHKLPRKPNLFWRCLIRLLTIVGMMGTRFRYETEGFEKIEKDQPCLILMNHTVSRIWRWPTGFFSQSPSRLLRPMTVSWACSV